MAYKGGTIERNLLSRMGSKGINIEILGCDKYAHLLTKYGIQPIRCQHHRPGDFHCSKHKVEVFSYFLSNILDDDDDSDWHYDTEPNDYKLT